MVRKVSALACVLALIFAFGMTAQAVEYTPYDGNPSVPISHTLKILCLV